MKEAEAYLVLGLPQNADAGRIRKKYRELIVLAHPDSFHASRVNHAGTSQTSHASGSLKMHIPDSEKYIRKETVPDARQINLAYNVLQRSGKVSGRTPFGKKANVPGNRDDGDGADPSGQKKQSPGRWDAPCNQSAYCERDVYSWAEDMEGNPIGIFTAARGKYLWTTDEDFPLFLKSIFHSAGQLLSGIDTDLGRSSGTPGRMQALSSLTYLMAQQFIDARSMLEELAVEAPSSICPDTGREMKKWLLPAMLEYNMSLAPGREFPEEGSILYPASLRNHRLYLKDASGRELGYLSFPDDRLYYVVIPLFEQHRVQVRIRAAGAPVAKGSGKGGTVYQNLSLYIRFISSKSSFLPENLNLQIKEVLERYRKGTP